jgi:hypothetical protein
MVKGHYVTFKRHLRASVLIFIKSTLLSRGTACSIFYSSTRYRRLYLVKFSSIPII